jgi:dienelactone hydrolase
LEIVHESVADGVTERRVDLRVDGEAVPGMHWLPAGTAAQPATILIGHGGTQHKQAPIVVALARRVVLELGYGAVALDAPAHGDRMTAAEREALAARLAAAQRDQAERDQAQRDQAQGAPGAPARRGLPPAVWRAMAAAMPRAVAEWKALADDLEASGTSGRLGYWGVSMGTVYGVPLLAAEPRIAAGVLGLGALRDGDKAQREQAAAITIPLLFLYQSDDQLMTRKAGLALWDAFGSAEKTMHINPGPHAGIPAFERDAVIAFYRRHLGG